MAAPSITDFTGKIQSLATIVEAVVSELGNLKALEPTIVQAVTDIEGIIAKLEAALQQHPPTPPA